MTPSPDDAREVVAADALSEMILAAIRAQPGCETVAGVEVSTREDGSRVDGANWCVLCVAPGRTERYALVAALNAVLPQLKARYDLSR